MAVTTSSGNGYALYNGVKLLNIDSVWTNKTTYPYAYVRYTDSAALASVGVSVPDDEYMVDVTFSSIPCAIVSSEYAEFNGTMSYKDYVYIHGDTLATILGEASDEWLPSSNDENVTVIGKEVYLPHLTWCSEDLLNTDNSVYLAASDPIPLDGMTVIEWDGDMTGLDVGTYISEGADSGYSLYKVAEYIPLRNGDVFAVHFVASNGAEIIGADDYYEAEFGAGGRCHSHLIISAPAGVYTPTVGTLTATITLPSDGLYLYSSDDGQARTTLYAYPASGESGDTTYDEKEFLSGLVMGLCGKGNPTFTASDVFGKGYLVGAELRSKRRLPVAYLYNGIRLPKLPELPYEYAVIECWESESYGLPYGRLICSSEPIFLAYHGFFGGHELLGDVAYFGFVSEESGWSEYFGIDSTLPANEWVKVGEEHFDERTFVQYFLQARTIWANHDLIYEAAGELVLAASDPVPVYE